MNGHPDVFRTCEDINSHKRKHTMSDNSTTKQRKTIGAFDLSVYKEWRFKFCFQSSKTDEVRKKERSNNVGLAEWKDKTVVYKFSKLPNWCVTWELGVYKALRDHLPSVKHFAKTYDVISLPLPVNEAGKAIGESPTPFTKKIRNTNVLIQKYIEGMSLADMISKDDSVTNTITYILEVLGIMRSSQHALEHTHWDPHCNNILLKEEKVEGSVVRLFDTGPKPLMLHGKKYRTVFTDFEYAYVDSMEGKNFDSKLDLFEYGYNPTTSDYAYDALRFLTSALYHFNFMHQNKSQGMKKLWQDLVQSTNSNTGNGYKFNQDGTMLGFKDMAKIEFFKSPRIAHLNSDLRKFLENRYYRIIGLLTHQIKLPFKTKNIAPSNNQSLVELILYLFTLNVQNLDVIIIFLYEVISGKTTQELVDVMKQYQILCDNPEAWISGLKLCIERSLDYIETIYSLLFQTRKLTRQHQNSQEYTPEKLIEWIYKQHPVCEQITPNTTVFWMTKKKLYKIPLSDVEKGELLPINSEKELWKRSKLLRDLVVKHQRALSA